MRQGFRNIKREVLQISSGLGMSFTEENRIREDELKKERNKERGNKGEEDRRRNCKLTLNL